MAAGPDTGSLTSGGPGGMLRTATDEYPHLNPSLIHTGDITDPVVLARDLLATPRVPTEITWPTAYGAWLSCTPACLSTHRPS